MAEVEVISEKLNNSTIVENGKPDDYWGFSLHEAFRMAIKFYKGIKKIRNRLHLQGCLKFFKLF